MTARTRKKTTRATTAEPRLLAKLRVSHHVYGGDGRAEWIVVHDTHAGSKHVCTVYRISLTGTKEAHVIGRELFALNQCDGCGDYGRCDPDCWYCHSPLCPANLRTLAGNLATAGWLCRSWDLRDDRPTWRPGCAIEPMEKR